LVGILALVFYLAAPVTWTWMVDWGFFPQQLGMALLPFCLLVFDEALEAHQDSPQTGRRRSIVAALVVLVLLASLFHMMVGAAALIGMGLFTVFASLTAEAGRKKATFISGLKVLALVVPLFLLTAATYLVPFYLYGTVANREGLNTPPPEQLHRLPVREFLGLSGMDPQQILTRMQFPLVVTGLAVMGLMLGALLRWRHANGASKALAVGLATVAGTAFVLSPEAVALVLRASPLLVNFVNFRSVLLLIMVWIPMVAGYGAHSLASLVLQPAATLQGPAGESPGRISLGRLFLPPVTGLLALGIAFVPAYLAPALTGSEPWQLPYGPRPKGLDLRDLWGVRLDDPCALQGTAVAEPPLCSVARARAGINIEELGQACDRLRADGGTAPDLCMAQQPTDSEVAAFLQQCRTTDTQVSRSAACASLFDPLGDQLLPGRWPAVVVSDQDPSVANTIRLAALLPSERPLRIDVSPYLGRLAQDLTTYADVSQINSYTYQITLIHEMWGYQQNVFYSREEGVAENGNPTSLNSLAEWFGTLLVFLNPDSDRTEIYPAAGWSRDLAESEMRILENPSEPGYKILDAQSVDAQIALQAGWKAVAALPPLEVWRNPRPTGLATVTTRPVVLVIGTPKSDAYMTLFRLANNGVLPYDEGFLVDGGPLVDAYTPEQLRPFDAVVLDGYDYKNSRKAWATLSGYVQSGGSLFVDTGWQYWVPEWEFANAPDVLPVARTEWTDYGSASDYVLEDPGIAGDVQVSQFKPLAWEGQAWSVSGTQPEDVRQWGRVVLAAAGRPLIVAGEYGRGRVVWSGMNLVAHAVYQGENAQELGLLRNLLRWLVRYRQGGDLPILAMQRPDPDHVEISFQPAPDKTTWVYWREATYPGWHASVVDSAGTSETPIYAAGPGFMLAPVPAQSEAVTVRLSWQPSLPGHLALVVSVIGIVLLFALLLDGLLLGGNGLTWLRIAITMQMPQPVLEERSALDMGAPAPGLASGESAPPGEDNE
jgi:hypothetical protein